jgi:SAM-dependent methyltransferase
MDLEYVECPVCGPSETRVWLDNGGTRYALCVQCRTVYASPRLSQTVRHSNVDTVWDYSPELLARESLRYPALQQEANYIQEHVQSGSLLDVGCSSGDLFRFFPDPSWERFGIELSSSAAQYAARQHNAHVIAGTLCSANWPSDFFDVVTMIDMLYLVDDPRTELDEVKRILKPKGLVAIEIAGQAYMFFRSRGLIALLMEGRWCRLNPDTHLYWFSPNGLQRLLKNSGLQPVAWYTTRTQARSNSFTNLISSAYYHAHSGLAGTSIRMLSWAPKFLCLARREKHS